MKLVLLLGLLGSVACSTTDPKPDSGMDASVDSGVDASADASTDASTDSGTDSGVSQRRIFVTDTVQGANFGGISGADALCASQAAAASLQGEFKAWLSTISSSVSDRLTQSTVPYVLVDGTVIANDWSDLTDGSILAPINLDATGQPRRGDVWTGTRADGLPYTGGDCVGFTSNSDAEGIGLCGSTGLTNARWTAAATPSCSLALYLYCIEQ